MLNYPSPSISIQPRPSQQQQHQHQYGWSIDSSSISMDGTAAASSTPHPLHRRPSVTSVLRLVKNGWVRASIDDDSIDGRDQFSHPVADLFELGLRR